MAKLEAPTGGSGLQITEIAPPGQYVATCLRVYDLFGVERPSFNNPNQKEVRDVTRFVFGMKDQSGRPYLVQTYEFTISGAPGSNLVKFLTSWLGQNPQMGWDYAEMLGRGAMITVQHKAAKANPGQIYATISGISPVFQQIAHMQPQASEFEAIVRALESKQPSSQPQQPPAPRPPGAGYPMPQQPPQQSPAPGYNYPPQMPPQAPPPQQPRPQQQYQQPPAPPMQQPPQRPAAPPPPPAARQFSPDGNWELINNQWVPVTQAQNAQQQAPTQQTADDDVPF